MDNAGIKGLQRPLETTLKIAKKKIDFNLVREIGLKLPGVEEDTTYGAPSLKVHGKLLTCPAIHRSAEPNTLVVKIDFDRRAELMEADPDVYYLTDHYLNYPTVLVRMSRINQDALRDLLGMAWQFVNSKTKTAGRTELAQSRKRKTRRR